MTGRVLFWWLLLSVTFGAGWALGLRIHRRSCEETMTQLGRALFNAEAKASRLEREREQP